jgi:putative endonuclease
MQLRTFYVYILVNDRNTVNYIGVTNDLYRRILEHREGNIRGFTQLYNIKKLVYYEVFDDIASAITREKQLKNWHRGWKLKLVKDKNPELLDVFTELLRGPETSSG